MKVNKIEKLKLENGLTIYLYKEERRKETFVSLVTRFGGLHHDFLLNDKKYNIVSGVAHFLEHYLLEHTIYGNLINLFGSMHLSSNGMTSIEKTEYYFSGVTNIEKALKILISALHNINFTEEKVEETKKAIYEEIRMGEDNKGRCLFRIQNECLFQMIPYQNTIGTQREIEQIDVSLARLCYKAFYRPQNECIFIAGNFDREKIIDIIKKCYQKVEIPSDSFSIIKYKEPILVQREKATKKMPTAEDIISITYKVDVSKLKSKEKLKLDFYLSWFLKMNAGKTSILNKQLEKEKIIIDSIMCDHMFIENICMVSFTAPVKKEDNFVKEVVNQVQNPIFKEDLFKMYQRDTMLEIAARYESIYSIMMPFLENIFTFSYEKEDTVTQIKSYTYNDFQKTIRALNFDQYVICKIKKMEEKIPS